MVVRSTWSHDPPPRTIAPSPYSPTRTCSSAAPSSRILPVYSPPTPAQDVRILFIVVRKLRPSVGSTDVGRRVRFNVFVAFLSAVFLRISAVRITYLTPLSTLALSPSASSVRNLANNSNDIFVIPFRVSRTRREMHIGHARPSLCLSVPRRMPTLLHGPGRNFGEW